jgi:crossover junction endodeoxyribonuclease RuvC
MALVQSQQFTGSGLGLFPGRCCVCTLARNDFPTKNAKTTLPPHRCGLLVARRGPAIHSGQMRVFGIDCGTEITGFGVVETDESKREPRLVCKALGAIRLAKTKPLPERLSQVYRELTVAIERWQPEVVAIEEVFYSVNAKSALKLGQVRGVAMLAAANLMRPVAEYAPLRIKSSVVGYGFAKKEQVQFMVARLLELTEVPEPPDAADALAIAICHIHTAQTLQQQGVLR